MSERTKKIIKWCVTFAFATLLTLLFYAYNNSVYKAVKSQATIWCDAFFCTAVLYLAAGGFALVSKHGGFNSFTFAAKKIGEVFKRGKKDGEDSQTYYEYSQEKQSKPKTSALGVLVTGAVFLAVSVVLVFISQT